MDIDNSVVIAGGRGEDKGDKWQWKKNTIKKFEGKKRVQMKDEQA